MGAALPDLQADLVRARVAEDWPRFVVLSELCDRFAQTTFIEPMEGYIRRMLWAAAAEGALPPDACDDPWGPPFQPRSATRSSVRCEMRARLERDFERFKRELPRDLAAHVREAYRIDLAARYLGHPLPHPDREGIGPALAESGAAGDRPGRRVSPSWCSRPSSPKIPRVPAPWEPGRSTRPG